MRRIFLFVITALVFLGLSGICNAQYGYQERVAIGAKVGAAVVQDPYSNVSADSSIIGNLNLNYFITPSFGLQLGVSRLETAWNYHGIKMGDLAVTPVDFIMIYRVLPGNTIDPYVGIGGAYLINNFETTSSYRYWYGHDVDVDNTFGVVLLLGLEAKVAPRLYVDLSFNYTGATADVYQKAGGLRVKAEDADLGISSFQVGLKYYF